MFASLFVLLAFVSASDLEFLDNFPFNSSQLVKTYEKANLSNNQYFETSYGSYRIRGYEPSSSGSYPLYIWLQGTSMNSWGSDCQTYTNYAASNGFVGVSVYYNNGQYPTNCNSFRSKASSIFDTSSSNSAISVLCARSNVNCDGNGGGVVVSGFSQGAQIASMGANDAGNIIKGVYEIGGGDRVTGGSNFASCLAYSTLSIQQTQIRSMVGENDGYFGGNRNGVRTQQIAITGYNGCSSNAVDCIQSDGSGWYIITNSQTAKNQANHCYAYTNPCGPSFDGEYYDGCESSCLWSFEANMGWLLSRL